MAVPLACTPMLECTCMLLRFRFPLTSKVHAVADIVLSFHLFTWSDLSAPKIAILEADPVVSTELPTGKPLLVTSKKTAVEEPLIVFSPLASHILCSWWVKTLLLYFL